MSINAIVSQVPQNYQNQNTQEQQKQEETNLFNEYQTWQDKSDRNQFVYWSCVEKYGENEDIIRDLQSAYFEKEAEIGVEFDFMEGKDFNNEEEYDEQTLKLGEGKVEQQDRNDDKEISFQELLLSDLTPDTMYYKTRVANGEMTEEQAFEDTVKTIIDLKDLFDIVDSLMGNGDGAITADEYQSWFKYLDDWSGTPGQPQRNGKFDALDNAEYTAYLLNQIQNKGMSRETAEKYAHIFLGF